MDHRTDYALIRVILALREQAGMFANFSCPYCGREYYDPPMCCTSDDCPGREPNPPAACA